MEIDRTHTLDVRDGAHQHIGKWVLVSVIRTSVSEYICERVCGASERIYTCVTNMFHDVRDSGDVPLNKTTKNEIR